MARVAYFAIEQAIQAQIAADIGVSPTVVVVEEPIMMGRAPKIYVFLESREEPPEKQSISAGKRTRLHVNFAIWVFAYAFHLADAIEARDDLLAAVELALEKDRTFGRADVNMSWLKGGDFDSAKEETGFNAGGEIKLVVDVTAVAP